MAVNPDLDLLDDDALAARARDGDRGALDVLYRRHAPAAWGLALAVTREPVAAEAAVAAGFAGALARSESSASEAARSALLRATRRAAIDAVPAPATAGGVPLGLAVDAVSPRVATIQAAFDALPERWRSVLWLVDVEGGAREDVARVIEISPESVDALLDRARLGFQEQVLLTGLRAPSPRDCRRTTDRLAAYASGALPERDAARVRSHLDGCDACRGRLAALDDLVPVLRSVRLALPLHLAETAAARWSASLGRNLGPLRLGLPGGQPMPVWAQRTFAGAVAAFVALGIAGATLLAGRGQGSGRDVVARPAGGESALGEPAPTDLDGDPLSSLPTTPPLAARPSSAPEIGTAVALPRTDGVGVVPDVDAPIAAPPTVDPPAEPEPEAGAEQVLTVDIPGVIGITYGDDCSGAQVGGNALGCAPTAGDDPLTLITPLTPSASSSYNPSLLSLLGL